MDEWGELLCGVEMERVCGLDSPILGPGLQGDEPELRASYAYCGCETARHGAGTGRYEPC